MIKWNNLNTLSTFERFSNEERVFKLFHLIIISSSSILTYRNRKHPIIIFIILGNKGKFKRTVKNRFTIETRIHI